jgi:hypothetical protein
MSAGPSGSGQVPVSAGPSGSAGLPGLGGPSGSAKVFTSEEVPGSGQERTADQLAARPAGSGVQTSGQGTPARSGFRSVAASISTTSVAVTIGREPSAGPGATTPADQGASVTVPLNRSASVAVLRNRLVPDLVPGNRGLATVGLVSRVPLRPAPLRSAPLGLAPLSSVPPSSADPHDDPGQVAVAVGLATRTVDGGVVFAPPSGHGPGPTVARDADGGFTGAAGPAESTVPTPAEPTSTQPAIGQPMPAPPTSAAAGGTAAPDLAAMTDELYERIELRLRRDLLLERERRGTLADW